MSGTPVTYPKRLIEVDLPIKEISAHARREKSIRHGHISTLHIWWARRPLAACRAVICASLWPDPADEHCPAVFRQEAARILCEFAAKVRSMAHLGGFSKVGMKRWQRTDPTTLRGDDVAFAWEIRYALLDFIADFANWDASNVPEFLDTSRRLTQAAHEALGGAPETRPLVIDPFAGGGTIPLEALRVGADTFASDINPVAVLLNKTVLELVPAHGELLIEKIREWGLWAKNQAEKSLGELYPNESDEATPIAYLWARTIKCEGPGCGAELPLLRSLWLAKKGNRSVALRVVASPKKKRVAFEIVDGIRPKDVGVGTITRGSATCPLCGYTTSVEHVRAQFKARGGSTSDARMYCCVVRTKDGRTEYRSPSPIAIAAASKSAAHLATLASRGMPLPTHSLPPDGALGFRVQKYGVTKWKDLFIPRQQAMLLTYGELIAKACAEVDARIRPAVHALLALTVSKMADFSSTLCVWRNVRTCAAHTFGRQTLSMVWDFAEMSPFAGSAGDFGEGLAYLEQFVSHVVRAVQAPGTAQEADAAESPLADDLAEMLFTDPPYYDAIPYSHLSEYFAFWLEASGVLRLDADATRRRREKECIVDEGLGKLRKTFEEKMTLALAEGRRVAKPEAIGVIVFAHKSTVGWETQLQAMLDAGWIVTASWPLDTERSGRLRAQDSAALASSIHLVCRPRENPDGSLRTDAIGDWRDVLTELPKRIHDWLPRLMKEGVVGADAIFACLGPALEIFSRYSRVEDAAGEEIKLKVYLEKVWEVVAREALSQIFTGVDTAGFEPDARLTAMWLWTLFGGASSAAGGDDDGDEEEDDDSPAKPNKATGFALEYDAARKIAQGLGAVLEDLTGLVEVKGETARLLSVGERGRVLFGQPGTALEAATKGKKGSKGQMALPGMARGADDEEPATQTGASLHNLAQASAATTVLDRVHQAMILFGQNRGVVLKRLLVEDGVGRDERFWRLANALNALYPTGSDERRWVEGVLTRRKALGL